MKIIFCIGKMNKGGAERVVCNLSNYLVRRGNKVIVIATEIKKLEYNFDKDIKLVALSKQSSTGNLLRRNFLRLKELRRIFIDEKPDLICAFLQEPIARLLFLKLISHKIRKIPSIVSVRINPETAFQGKRKLALPLYRLSDGFVFQTEEIKQFFGKKIQSRSAVISNPVDSSFFNNDSCTKQEILIISVGRLTKQKNYPMLLRAFKAITIDYPDMKLEIYGEGELRKRLEKLIRELKLQDRVFLMGNTSDIKTQLRRAKVFVLTSNFEGVSNALMEAMASGVPSIATNSAGGGSASLITNYNNGILVPVNNSKLLAKEIRAILSDEKLYKSISANSKASMLKYRPEKVYNEWLAYILRVANRGEDL